MICYPPSLTSYVPSSPKTDTDLNKLGQQVLLCWDLKVLLPIVDYFLRIGLNAQQGSVGVTGDLTALRVSNLL